MPEEHGWMVRAGNDNELIDYFVDRDVVAIGWSEIGDLSDIDSREEVKRRYEAENPTHSKFRIGVNTGQLYRFAVTMKNGDLIFTYDKSVREYHVGRIIGPYRWRPNDSEASDDYPHHRSVEWEQTISRDAFTTAVKNSLGSSLTVFSLDEQLDPIERVLSGEEVDGDTTEEEGDSPPYFEEVQATAEELISDQIANIDPFDFEELVAAVLRAMDFTATTTESGSDRGVDIIAHPDALGFESPFIKVQVKHRSSTTGGPAMREFTGTLDSGEKGLYVSTGGFTRDAREEARNARQRIALLDRDDFIDLLLQQYEALEPEYKTYVPLKQVYVPTSE